LLNSFADTGLATFSGTLTELLLTFVIGLMVFFGLSHSGCDFALRALQVIIRATVSTLFGDISGALGLASRTIKEIPRTIKTVLTRFEESLELRSTVFACCPKCCCNYPPSFDKTGKAVYPHQCGWKSSDSSSPCGALLLEGTSPIRPFVFPDFFHFIARLLSDGDIEGYIDTSCQEGLEAAIQEPSAVITSPFQGEFLRTIKGPDGARLFIDGGSEKEARLVFSLNVDWFNVN